MNNDEILNVLMKTISQINDTKSLSITYAKELFYLSLKRKNNNIDTIRYYQNIFCRIDKFFNDHNVKETAQINDDLLNQLIDECLSEDLSANYINKLVSAIKYLVKTLMDQDLISHIHFKVKKLKVPEKRLDIIESNVLKKIFNFIETQDLRTYLIVSMLLATGLRRKELTLVKLKNISFDDNSIIVEDSKTKVIRTIFFPVELNNTIKLYLKTCSPKTYLFEKETKGIPIEPRTISRVLEKIKVCLNLEKLSAHQFRHTFGTIIYESSKDIELTRQLLGHSNYMMTKRYVHHSKDKLKSQYEKFQPLKSL